MTITMTPNEVRVAILAGTAPDGLTVKGSLYLLYGRRLTSLPTGLTVGEDLYLDGCTGLTSLPLGLTVGGELRLQGCTGLAHLCVGRDRRGYEFYGIQMADGLHVTAGCRNFLLENAKHHWADNPECLALVHLIEAHSIGGMSE